jgi:hypothetical protein
MRTCYEVPTVGDGSGVTATSSGNPVRPDIPNGLKWSAVGGNPGRILVDDENGTAIPKATWSGMEAEAAAKWGTDRGGIEKLLK